MNQTNKLYYELKGEGPTVVLVAGMLGSTRYWDTAVENLNKRGYQTLTIDLLGFGKSPKPRKSEYTIEQHSQSIVKVLESVMLNNPVTLVGLSMSATILTETITQKPELFKQAIFFSPMIYSNSTTAKSLSYKTGNVPRYVSQGPIAWFICHTLCRVPSLAKHVYRAMDTNNLPTQIIDDAVLHTWRSYRKSFMNVLIRQDLSEKIANITVPTTLVYGKNDPSIETDFLTHLATDNKNITLRKSNAIHHPMIEDYSASLKIITSS